MIRICVRIQDYSNCSQYTPGGTVYTTMKTFEIEHPEIEKFLSQKDAYKTIELVGAEVVPTNP